MKLPLLAAVAVVAAAGVAAFTLVDDGAPETVLSIAKQELEPGSPAAGEIRFVRNADTGFEDVLLEATPKDMAFIRDHYWQLRGYPPFSDEAIAWAPPIQFYSDLYALYPSVPSQLAAIEEHPEWILRDDEGNRLYVPFACAGGTCPAYAADPGSESWRTEWIADAKRQLRKGYAGVFIDNVNMRLAVSDGEGEPVRPLDPRTGREMTLADWQRYVAEFTQRIRRELPGAQITHNVIWFAKDSPLVIDEIEAADYVELERGFSDPGIVGDDGSAYRSFLGFIDRVHSLGRSVMLEPLDLDDELRIYELANYFLVNDGRDAIAADYEADPANWWPGWDTDLGAPLGPRTESGGILRRAFENGVVYVNPPGSPERTLELSSPHVDLEGVTVESVTLGPAQGAVLRTLE